MKISHPNQKRKYPGMGRYILDAKRQPVYCADLIKWAVWFEWASRSRFRIVANEYVGAQQVSTVFLGLDHNFSHNGRPILWETMTFPGNDQTRCSGTWKDAVKMHMAMIRKQFEIV